MERKSIQKKSNFKEWLGQPVWATRNWVICALISLGELASHWQNQSLFSDIVEFAIVFLIISFFSYKFGWFWNWFSKKK